MHQNGSALLKSLEGRNGWTGGVWVEKAEEPEIKLPTSAGSLKKQERSRKTSISALLTMPKPWTVWITRNMSLVKLFNQIGQSLETENLNN